MIGSCCKTYCCEDISKIENYENAINDKNELWEIHHRLETELNVSKQYLIDNNLYGNRPASELIFLRHDEHRRLHNNFKNYNYIKGSEPWNKGKKGCYKQESLEKMRISHVGIPNLKNKGRKHTEEEKQKMKANSPHRGKPAMIRGRKAVYKNNQKIMVKQEELEKYFNEGWMFWRDYKKTII